MNKDEAVIAVAKEQNADEAQDGIHILTTGARVRVMPVAPALISRAQMAIEFPQVPTFYNSDKDREEENPNHPGYIAAVASVNEQRGMAALDAMCMFGLELVDGVPEGNDWIQRLKFVIPTLEFDEDDPVAREYYYKTLVAVGLTDFTMLARRMGVSAEGVAQAEQSFPGNAQRDGNQGTSAKKGHKRRG